MTAELHCRDSTLQAAPTFHLAGYVPGAQHVFVMTYAKSGTNWAMQIAHQLIYHGTGDAPQGGSSELLSPERQRAGNAHFKTELTRLGSDSPYDAFCDVAP